MPKTLGKTKTPKKQEARTIRLTIDIPDDLHRAFKVYCARKGVTMSDQFRAILEDTYPDGK